MFSHALPGRLLRLAPPGRRGLRPAGRERGGRPREAHGGHDRGRAREREPAPALRVLLRQGRADGGQIMKKTV